MAVGPTSPWGIPWAEESDETIATIVELLDEANDQANSTEGTDDEPA